MGKRSNRRTWLLSALAVTGGLWAYDANFTGDPNDTQYPKTANSQGCANPMSPTCVDPPGQWDMYSTPATVPATAHPSGISADLAWRITAGRPDVEAVVFDTGVNYDHEDLRNQIWLNCGELLAPFDSNGQTMTGSSPGCREPTKAYDLNGDGIFNIRDYQDDSRVTASTILPAILSRSDLRFFEDLIDNDGNGHIDDISGFDFDDNDGDEYDHRDFGHGTGRAGVLAAQANNSAGIAGMCTNCRIASARIEDTYVVVRADTTANAAIWAADHGFEVINMSLGHVGASSMSRKAFEYAWRHNVLAFSAIANEFHFHHGYVGLYDDVFAVGALAYAGPTTTGIAPNNGQPTQAPTTYLRKANYSNYGAHLQVVAPSDNLTTRHKPGSSGNVPSNCTENNCYADSSGTSSATPHVAGTAALVYSIFRNCRDGTAPAGSACVYDTTGQALADISNREVWETIVETAYDIKGADDSGGTGTRVQGTYPVSTGWDKWTGYGRVHAENAVKLIQDGKIPPEADINSPDWYTYVTGIVPVKFYANNRWRGDYTWVLEAAAGVEPTTFTEIASGTGTANKALSSTSLVDTHSVNWDTTALADGGYTLRLRVADIDPDCRSTGVTCKAEDRMFVWVRRGLVDADNHPNFPVRITRSFNGEDIPVSAESMSNPLVDLDGDNHLEIIVATSDGEVRAYKDDGTLHTGFGGDGIVSTDPMPGRSATSPAFDGNLANGEVPIAGAFIIGGTAVGDIDRDGGQEICAGAVNGKLYCWNADGSVQSGFPVSADLPKRYNQYTQALTTDDLPQGEALVAPPTFGNLDGDPDLEIAAAARDQKLYVWKSDGTRLAPFPLSLGTIADKAPFGSISGVLIADIDKDGANDILVGTNEVSGSLPNTAGRIYAFAADGTAKTGWPVSPSSAAADGVPIVAQGVVNGPLAANFDTADTQLEVVGHAFLGDPIIYQHTGTQLRTLSGSHSGNAPPQTSPDPTEDTAAGGPARSDDAPVHTYVGLGAIAEFSTAAPAGLEYMVGTVGNNLVVDVGAGSGQVTNFDHYFSAWSTATGNHVTNFPRVAEGWQFVTGPAVADLDNAGGPEAIVTSSGLFVHAFNNGNGANPTGWPKFTGHWEVNTPSVGDLDDNGTIEVVTSDRLGYLHAWNTTGLTCNGAVLNAQWRKYRHDEWNTGSFDADTVRPAKVSNLLITQNGASLQAAFTAVGDDGRCGTAAAYQVLVNGTPATGLPAPKAAGEAETLSFAGTLSDTVELRVIDDAGNTGAPAVVLPADAVQRTSPSMVKGGLGDAITIATFSLPNTDAAPRSVTSLTLTFGRPALFSQVVLTGPDGSVTVDNPAATQVFTFASAQSIPAGGSATFTLTGTLTTERLVALEGSALWAGSAFTLFGLLALCLARLRQARWLMLAGLLLSACNGSSGGTLKSVASQQALSQIAATKDGGAPASYSGLPLDLGTVTLQYR